MMSSLKKLLLPLAILVIIGFLLFLVNQIAGVYLLVHTKSALLADILLVVLLSLVSLLIGWPVVLYLKLPKPLKLPAREDELQAYRTRLIKRLAGNRLLKTAGLVPRDEDSLATAIAHLDHRAAQIVKHTATTVFLTTSVSQNGKLDALTILATQSRMVWKIAHIYYQRPSLRELAYLYAHIATTSFLASEIEELDISQQLEPVLSCFLKNSAGKSIPILGPTANIILDSLLEGSTNAFLTLRVGNVARKYCGCNEVQTRQTLRKQAFAEAASQLRSVVASSSGKIVSGLMKASRKAGTDTLKAGWDSVKHTGTKVAEGVKRVNPFQKKPPPNAMSGEA